MGQRMCKIKEQAEMPVVSKAHQKLLTVVDSFGLAEIAFSLEITLITFPSTTGTT